MTSWYQLGIIYLEGVVTINNIYKIYAHINKYNNKIYIGQTKSKELNKRWLNGFGYKNNSHFWNAIQKYGWNNFEHLVLIENLSLDMANIIEEELIRKYKTTNPQYGYNLKSGGLNNYLSDDTKRKISKANKGRGKGRKLSKETKRKISIATKGENNPYYDKKHTDEERKRMSENKKGKYIGKDNPKAKSVHQYSLDGKYISTFDCIKNGKEATGCLHISDVCLFKIVQDKGFVWRFADEYPKYIDLPSNEVKKIIEKSQKGKYHPKARYVKQYDLNNLLIREYWGATEASKITKIPRSCIIRCCLGEQYTAGGFKWQYADKEGE